MTPETHPPPKGEPEPPAQGPPDMKVFLGQLARAPGLTLTQLDSRTLAVDADGEPALKIPCRAVAKGGNWYLEATLKALLASPRLAAAMAGRFDFKRKNIRLHTLSAIVERRADATGSARGNVGIHHVNLDPGDNRASNLRTLSTKVHNAWHRTIDALTPEARQAYLDSIPSSADGLGDGLPAPLREAIAADLAALETPPKGAN